MVTINIGTLINVFWIIVLLILVWDEIYEDQRGGIMSDRVSPWDISRMVNTGNIAFANRVKDQILGFLLEEHPYLFVHLATGVPEETLAKGLIRKIKYKVVNDQELVLQTDGITFHYNMYIDHCKAIRVKYCSLHETCTLDKKVTEVYKGLYAKRKQLRKNLGDDNRTQLLMKY